MTCSLDLGQEDASQTPYSLSDRFKKSTWHRKRPMGSICGPLEKAFNRVPRDVLWWALRQPGVDECIVPVIESMYDGALTSVKLGVSECVEFAVKFSVHQGWVFSPLLFIIILEALSKIQVGLPWELFYADDLTLLAESTEELLEMIRQWKDGMEQKGKTYR